MADVVLIDLDASYGKFKAATKVAVEELNKVDAATQRGAASMRGLQNAANNAGTTISSKMKNANESVLSFNKRIDGSIKTIDSSARRTTSSLRGLENVVNKAGGVANTRFTELNKTVVKSGGLFSGLGKSASTGFNAVGSSLANIVNPATLAIAAIAGTISIIKSSIDAASDLAETTSKAGELFGESTGAVINWSKGTATAIGQSSQQALDGAASFAIFGRAAGLSGAKLVDFSTDFVELASDLASFNNTSPEEAITAITSALRGEAEPIRKYGILLDDATLRQEAMTLGIIKNIKTALTPQQKVLAAQAAIYKQTSAAQGDFARTSEGLANQNRILSAQWKDLKATLGQGLLPVMLDYVQTANAIFQGDLSKAMDPLTNTLKGIAAGFINLSGVMNGFVDELSVFEQATLKAANMTDKELNVALNDLAKFSGRSKEEFQKMADTIRQNEIHQTFLELARALAITEAQYKSLTDISDKYGISARINSSLILDIKQSTDQDLNNAFVKFNKTLGVTKKDFDDYTGKVKEIPPIQDAAAKSTDKLVGPYDKLAAAVTHSLKALQDQVTLFSQNKSTWDEAIQKAHSYADAQNTIVEVNDLVTDALKRQPEAVRLVGTQMEVAVIKYSNILARLKITHKELLDAEKLYKDQSIDNAIELVDRREALFTNLGINQTTQYKKNIEEIKRLQDEEIAASDGTLESIYKISAKYNKALLVNHANQVAATAGALADTATALSTALGQIFGDAAQKSVLFLSFQKALAIASITLKSYEAIASGIAAITASISEAGVLVNPLQFIAGLTAIISGVGNLIGGIVNQVAAVKEPTAPSFSQGTDYVKRGNNPQGIDTIPALLNEGEGIATTEANRKNPGVIKAMNDGNFESFIINKFVTPTLQAREIKSKNNLADNLANSMMIQNNSSFDDYRLYRVGAEQASLLRENNALLRSLSKKNNRRNIN